MTGPSLAGIWGDKAGLQEGFHRYSKALKDSGIVWSDSTLDQWLANPQRAVPGNFMLFQGLPDEQARADLIEFLRLATRGKGPPARQARGLPSLKQAPPKARIVAIRHCGDTYFVTNAEQETRPFWEFNLRFKTDSGPSGPAPGQPVMVRQGMQGDRAQVVFAAPEEISRFIEEKC